MHILLSTNVIILTDVKETLFNFYDTDKNKVKCKHPKIRQFFVCRKEIRASLMYSIGSIIEEISSETLNKNNTYSGK